MYRYKEIKELLGQHDYVPVVSQWGDGCLVRLPHPKLTRAKLPRLREAYAIQRGDNPGFYYSSSFLPDERFLKVPEYALRLLIMTQVFGCCKALPISHELTVFLNEAGEEVGELEEIIPGPTKQEDQTKEGFLVKLFSEARDDGFLPVYEEVAFSHGVHEGYKLCKSLTSS